MPSDIIATRLNHERDSTFPRPGPDVRRIPVPDPSGKKFGKKNDFSPTVFLMDGCLGGVVVGEVVEVCSGCSVGEHLLSVLRLVVAYPGSSSF